MAAGTIYRLASTKQVALIGRLLAEKVVGPAHRARLEARIADDAANPLTSGEASRTIEWLLRRDRVQAPSATVARGGLGDAVTGAPVTEEGIYEHDGAIYRVKRGRESGKLYAQVLTDRAGVTRLTQAGTVIEATYEYAPGAFTHLRAENRMTAARAEALSIVFSFCIRCHRHLKAAESVSQGIGPVCRKKI